MENEPRSKFTEMTVFVILRNGKPVAYQNFVYEDEQYARGLVKQYKEHVSNKNDVFEYRKAKLIY